MRLLSNVAPLRCRVRLARLYSTGTSGVVNVMGKDYTRDHLTNITPTIISKLSRKLYNQPGHPLSTLRALIESHFADYAHLSSVSPIVSPAQNFDGLSFPADHPGRSPTDSYYINKHTMLRTHTSAHEVEVFARGTARYLLTADVYRRDEIDASHYPVFHQMEGARVVSADSTGMAELTADNARLRAELARSPIVIDDIPHFDARTNPHQPEHDPAHAVALAENLKLSLNGLLLKLFGGRANLGGDAEGGEPLRVRWVETTFPWTAPSFEAEVLFRGEWLEILGCGVVRQKTLENANVPDKLAWAFGLGLERIAMILYSIPDIRLFWSDDPRFAAQFAQGEISAFRPYSRYPACYKDVSFWRPDVAGGTRAMHENDFCDLVRDVAGDLVEDVTLTDEFEHPTTKRQSVCYRINYRSMDRSLSNDETNALHAKVVSELKNQFGAEIR
ncbi:phenylalanyl-tRNA synthetase [Coniophora puteana RWD-64-598 SS2]|uniref:Phenylalanine--tRNA ligase, mitochondrial n=1 Tax=Coniophora puteana (strain RWD-64-598) TaxID=741705 RepID=A0A5M3N1C3_CONPW|nr:phenylalanyl-tRNA synthetase [Coniophora puteana RWD-64-598 SS2]EIW85189.1 phenylalanyl-tRNA synthetase [Coniophora puteana RWD-64-598 SS2]